jgi:hypothetical protein
MQRTRGEQLRGALAQVAAMEQLLIAAGVQLPPPPLKDPVVQMGQQDGVPQVQVYAPGDHIQAPAVAGIRRVRHPVTGRRIRAQAVQHQVDGPLPPIFVPPAVGPLPIVLPPIIIAPPVVGGPGLYDALCGQVQALGGGQLAAANFLMFTRAYKDLNLLQESTPLSVVTGRQGSDAIS